MPITFQEREYYQVKREENFRNKTPAQIKASIKGHKGQMTKLGKQADQTIEACRALPTKRAIAELEEIKWRLQEKLADLEYGYSRYTTEDPDTEQANTAHINKIQEEYLVLSDSILAALNIVPITAAPRAAAQPGGIEAKGVKIREGLRPDRLKMDFTPSEFRRWKTKLAGYFTASNLIIASNMEQRSYLDMCIDTEIADKLEAHRDITVNSPVLEYEGRPETAVTCLDAIEQNFKIRYPLTSRRHELMQMKQPRGELMSTHSAKMKGLMLDADISTMTIEELMSTLLICSCTNEELKDELLKLGNPTVEQIDEAIENYERKKNDLKRTSEGSKAYVAKQEKGRRQSDQSRNKPTCWACGYEGHRAPDCRKKKESLHCKKCKKSGHVTKVCGQLKNLSAKVRQTQNEESSSSESEEEHKEEAKAARASASTPPMLL